MSSMGRKRGRENTESTVETTKRAWSDLPKDLLSLITNRPDMSVDLPRIRAVCKSWRSSIPCTLPKNNSFRIHINPHWGFTVEESTLCRFKYKRSKSRAGGFLVKVRGSQPSRFSLFNPLYYHQGSDRLEKIPKGLNLLAKCCYVYEFQKNYEVKFQDGGFSKAAYSVENSTLLFCHPETGLVFVRAGDDELTKLDYKFDYLASLDITLYNGNFYVIENHGKIIVIDPLTMNITLKMNVPYDGGKKKYFVQSQDDLYVVNRNIDMRIIFTMFRLSESACTWEMVSRMRDQVVFISEDCSFVASLSGFLRNSIYFTNDSNSVFCSDKYCSEHEAELSRHFNDVFTFENLHISWLQDCQGFRKHKEYGKWLKSKLIPMYLCKFA